MELINIITLIVGGSGIIGAGVTVYQTRKTASSAAATTRVEAEAANSADWATFTARIQAHMDYQDKQIDGLRAAISNLKDDRRYDREHIRILQRQIYAGIGPPPLKPGDPWPEDQIGG